MHESIILDKTEINTPIGKRSSNASSDACISQKKVFFAADVNNQTKAHTFKKTSKKIIDSADRALRQHSLSMDYLTL